MTNTESQKNTSPTQMVLEVRLTTEPIGKNTQIALCAHKQSLMSDTRQNQLEKMPKWHSVLTNSPQWQRDIGTYWQNAQIALCAYQWSSTSDTQQNQLAKCPITCHAQKRSLPRCTLVDLLSLGACQLFQMHVSVPPRKSISWQPVPSRGETGRIPKTNGFGSC